jgi:hypothetical protein
MSKPCLVLLSVLAFVSLTFSVWQHSSNPALASGSNSDTTCNAKVLLRVYEYKNYMDYTGSPIRNVVRVQVSYQRQDIDQEPIDYENLWYHGVDILGCRKQSDLELDRNSHTEINVEFDGGNPTYDQAAAAANAVSRIFLDTTLKRGLVLKTTVPANAYFPVLEAFEHARFYTYDRAREMRIFSSIMLPIQSTDGHKQLVVYAETH